MLNFKLIAKLFAVIVFCSMLNITYAATNNDNYYSEVQSRCLWKNPRDLQVYIDKKDPNYYLYKSSFETWQKYTNGHVTFRFVGTKNSANITCETVDTLSRGSHNSIGVTIVKLMSYTQSTKKVNCEKKAIEVLNVNPVNHEVFSKDQIRSIVLHEIGHALGIDGHSSVSTDLMYYSTNKPKGLSARDVNTIKKIYSY